MRFIIIIATISVILGSCVSKSTSNTAGRGDSINTKMNAMPITSNLGDTISLQLKVLIDNYYELKNALVASSPINTGAAAAKLAATAGILQAQILKNAIGIPEQKPFLDTIIIQTKEINTIVDNTCEHQRIAFGLVSSAVYELLKSVDVKNIKIYHEYCPMAFNEKGAYWLSDVSEIQNPYFGKKMMECGEVTDSL